MLELVALQTVINANVVPQAAALQGYLNFARRCSGSQLQPRGGKTNLALSLLCTVLNPSSRACYRSAGLLVLLLFC